MEHSHSESNLRSNAWTLLRRDMVISISMRMSHLQIAGWTYSVVDGQLSPSAMPYTHHWSIYEEAGTVHEDGQ
uniref:Phospholipase B-like n=1 Tax=Ascaris lumbricoides TaxID=6252 RepID=A0A0M3HPC7_ASCLU